MFTYRTMRLTKGQIAKVSIEDYKVLSQWKWGAMYSKLGRCFYAVRFDGKIKKTVFMHRQLLGLEHGDKRRGDHINHDTLDNTRDNLRIASRADSVRNRKNWRKGRMKGAYLKRGKHWFSAIRVDYKLIHLGKCESEMEAHERYRKAAKKYFGEFACTT